MRKEVEALFESHRLNQARAYSRQQRLWIIANWLFSPLYFALWLHPLARQWLQEHIIATLHPWGMQVAATFLVLGAGYWLLQTLLAIPREYLARRYELSTQNWEQWITERLKAGLITGGLGMWAVLLAYGLLRITPSLWWFWMAVIGTLVMLGLQIITPILIAPLFFHFEPLDDKDIRERIMKLTQQAGIKVVDVFRFDMSKRTEGANAAVLGIGPTQRIVVADTLLDTFPPEEAETILAHELGHYVHKDLLLGFGLQAITLFVAFYLVHLAISWTNPEGFSPLIVQMLPLGFLVLTLYSMVVAPLTNIWLRAREIMADLFAVLLTQKPRVYARALARLSDQNLIDPSPPAWYTWIFATHPPMEERIALVLDLAEDDRSTSTKSPKDTGVNEGG